MSLAIIRKNMTPYITLAKSHYYSPSMCSDMAGHHDKIADHSANPAASNFPFLPWRTISDGPLADHPEYVVSYKAQFKDKRIGSKLAGRKPLEIHIRFYLTVELFTLSVGVVQSDDLPVGLPRLVHQVQLPHLAPAASAHTCPLSVQ